MDSQRWSVRHSTEYSGQAQRASAQESARISVATSANAPVCSEVEGETCSAKLDRLEVELQNHGLTVVDLEIRNIQQANFSNERSSIVETGGVFKTIVETGAPDFSFEMVFTDMLGGRRAMLIDFKRSTQDLKVREIDV